MPLWVKLGHSAMFAECRLYPNKRTSTDAAGMSRKRHRHRRKQHLSHLAGAGDDETGGDCPAER
jgi:hypothetical protein